MEKCGRGRGRLGPGGRPVNSEPYVTFNIEVGIGYFELSIDGRRLSDHLLNRLYAL